MGNLNKAVIALLALLPSLVFYLSFQFQQQHYHGSSDDFLSPLWLWCSYHPILLANLLFFINVNLLFWLIGLIQSSHWMISLYWTVIPLLLVHYYATHPLSARYNLWRSRVVILLTWAWSIRICHNYFRRENWQWGVREDWRFANMRHRFGEDWWWLSFFAVYLAQQVLMMGICLPMYAIHSIEKAWNVLDFFATMLCISGITVAYFADTQLHDFQIQSRRNNNTRLKVGPVLEQGLWRISRHPNYLGEQLWWWGLAIFGMNVGHGWTSIGSLINSLCLAHVTMLVEQRMLKQEYRADAYRLYQKTTSVWIPWFKSSPRAVKDKNT